MTKIKLNLGQLDHISNLPAHVPLTNQDGRIIGEAHVVLKDGEIQADCQTIEQSLLEKMKNALQVNVTGTGTPDKDGVIRDFRLLSCSLSFREDNKGEPKP
jgi:hypothetical protein